MISFLLLLSLFCASGTKIEISGCSKEQKPSRIVFGCVDLEETNADLDADLFSPNDAGCRELPPFEAIFHCSLTSVPNRQTIKDVFKISHTFQLEDGLFTDQFSEQVGDPYLGRDLQTHCRKCNSVIVVRQAEIFATTKSEYQALAEAATAQETLSSRTSQPLIERDLPVVIFWRPQDAVDPFSVAKMGMSIFGRVKIQEPAVADSCRFFQRKVSNSFEDLGVSMLAFFSPNGNFAAYSRLPSLKERHGYSSQILQTLLNIVAKKKVPLSWPVPPKVINSFLVD